MASRKAKLTTPKHNTLLEIGSWNNLPHYSVIGNSCSFYLWKNEDKHGANTNWITGRAATEILSKLRNLRVKGKSDFIDAFKQYYTEHQK